MKNYLNSEERTRHIVLMAMQETSRDFLESDALSDEEIKELKKCLKAIEKFNCLIFERLGDAYQRKIEKTMQANTLKLVGKYSVAENCISHSASEDIAKGLKEIRLLNCIDCEKCDFKNCGAYCMFIACDVEGTKTTSGCPFIL